MIVNPGLLGLWAGLPPGHPGEKSRSFSSISLLATQGTQLDLLGYGWRGPYVLAALPGILTAALVIFTLKEPSRQAVVIINV